MKRVLGLLVLFLIGAVFGSSSLLAWEQREPGKGGRWGPTREDVVPNRDRFFIPEDPYGHLLTRRYLSNWAERVEKLFVRLFEMKEGMGLEPKQVEALDEIRYEYQVRQIKLQAKVNTAALKLSRFLRHGPPDFKEAAATAQELSKDLGEIVRCVIETIEKVYNTLKPSQREFWQELVGE